MPETLPTSIPPPLSPSSPPSAAQPRFPWFLSAAFILCVVLLVSESFSFVLNMRNLDRSRRAVTEDITLQRELEAFKAKFFAAEGGFRGYINSGDTGLLEPYHRLIGDYKSDLARLAGLVSDSAAPDPRLVSLSNALNERLKQMADRIEVRERAPQGASPPGASADAGEVRGLDQAIQNGLGGLEEEAARQLDLRRSEAQKITLYGLVFILGSGLLGVAGLAVFYLLTRKYFFRQDATESELRLRDVELRALFDMAAVGIVECAADTGGILRANSKLCALLGYSSSELDGMSFFQLLPPGSVAGDRQAWERQFVAEGSGRWSAERRCLRRDGQAVWVRMSFALLSGQATLAAGGALQGAGPRPLAVGIVEDINDRMRIEQSMQDNAAILRAIAEDTRDLICVKDLDGRLIMANPAFLDFIGKPRDEVLGHAEIDYLEDPAQAKRMRDLDRRLTRERTTEYVEEEITAGGATHVFLSTKVPYTSQDNEVIGMVSIARDITERKQAERELLHSRDRLASDVRDRNQQLASLSRHLIRASEQEKGKLARELHDELGSALAAISMDMGWVLNHVRPLSPDIAARQERALQGVRDTLDLKRRLVDGLRPLTLEHFGFEFALRTHCEAFSESARMPVEVIAPEQMPAIPHETGLALFRMVQECLTNVAKHAHASRVRVTIDASSDQNADRTLMVRVEDDGRGLPQNVAKSPESSYGLVSMRERIAAVGGVLSIGNSVEFQGVMAEATIPLEQAPAAEPTDQDGSDEDGAGEDEDLEMAHADDTRA
jgi:PAS domain S-box-containing protein